MSNQTVRSVLVAEYVHQPAVVRPACTVRPRSCSSVHTFAIAVCCLKRNSPSPRAIYRTTHATPSTVHILVHTGRCTRHQFSAAPASILSQNMQNIDPEGLGCVLHTLKRIGSR